MAKQIIDHNRAIEILRERGYKIGTAYVSNEGVVFMPIDDVPMIPGQLIALAEARRDRKCPDCRTQRVFYPHVGEAADNRGNSAVTPERLETSWRCGECGCQLDDPN